MLNFILGRKGGGKTAIGHNILKDAIEKGSEAMLIVPKQFTFESDKGILSVMSADKACRVEVLSFVRLCHIALQTYGGIKKPIARDGVRSILMSVALQSVSDSLTVFSRHKNEISLVQKMLSQLDEMKNNGITPEKLEKCAGTVGDKILSAKMRETALVARAYDAVVSQSYFDDADLLGKVADILAGTEFFKGKTIVIDGFSSFSFGEYRLICEMLKKAENVYVALCAEGTDNVSDLSPFAVASATARRLRLLAGNNGVETGEIIKAERSGYPEDLEAIENNLYLPDYKTADKCNSVSVICCNNIQNECDTVGRKIKALIRTGEYRCRDISVIFRQDEKYEAGVKKALKKYGVPLFEDRRQPVSNQPLISLVRNLLSICAEGFTTDYIFRYCKTGLTQLTFEEISVLENYAFAWDIKGTKWLSEWKENPYGFSVRDDEESKALLKKINSYREAVVLPLEKLKTETEFSTGRDIAAKIYYFLRDNKVDESLKSYALVLEKEGMHELALEQEQVWDILMETLDEIGSALGESYLTAKRFLELFEITVSTKSLGKLPDGFDEVSIVSAERALTKKSKVVFLVGMNADVFPLVHADSGIFSRRERVKIAAEGIEELDNLRDLTVKERFLCYNALSSAEERLILCYSLSDGSGKDMAGSECIEWVKKILPMLKESYSTDAGIDELIESEGSAYEVMAKNWHKDTPKVNSLKKYFCEKEEYSGKIEALEGALSGENFRFTEEKNALELFGRRLYFSSTQLDNYTECPFKYFCRYGLRANPRLRAELDGAKSGNAIHDVLENLLRKYRGREFLKLTPEQLDEEIKAFLKEYLDSYMGGAEDKTERFIYLYSRMHKILISITQKLIEEFSLGEFEMSDFELSIGPDEKVRSFAVELEQGIASFMGKIDRVDRLDLEGKRYIRVVDYKTGIKQFSLSDVLGGINMQMLLYLISIWRNGQGEYEGIIPSGVLYFPARIVPNNAQRGDDEEKLRKGRYQSTNMSGMLLYDEEVIRRMDKNLDGVFIPAKYDKKKDCLTGQFITLGQFELLAQRLDGYIKQIGDSIHKGLIGARPVYGNGNTDICSYCNYSEICMNKTKEPRYIEKLKHEECLGILEGGEENVEKLD